MNLYQIGMLRPGTTKSSGISLTNRLGVGAEPNLKQTMTPVLIAGGVFSALYLLYKANAKKNHSFNQGLRASNADLFSGGRRPW